MSLNRIIAFVFLLLPFHLFSQVISVSQARALPPGANVKVRGVVTNGSELGKIRYLQDGTAGIAAYPGTGSAPGFELNVHPGDSVEVTGPTVSFNGLLEINPVTAWQVISSGNPLPAPKPVSLSDLTNALEGQLISVACTAFENAGGSFTGAGTYVIHDNTGVSSKIYLPSGHPMLNSGIPPDPVRLTAILSDYDGFQLLPRSVNDLAAVPCFYFSENPVQSEIQTDGFKITWETNLPATAKLRFGAASPPVNEIDFSTQSQSHTYELTGLTPGQIYWVQIEATHDGDIILSKNVPFATRSLSSGQIKLYFNHPIDVPTANGLLPDGQSFGEVLDETIARINAAQQSIDVAMYNSNRTDVTTALAQAVARGVRVRYVAAIDASNTALVATPSFPVVFGNEHAIMHDKFMVVDADMTNDCWVMSGSMNWTTANMTNDFNNTLFIQDQSLARTYELEFEEMWGSGNAVPEPANSRFGAMKQDNTPHRFIIADIPVESYFSPSDQTTRFIKETIQTADSEALFAMFSFTNDIQTAALLEVRNNGADVRGMIENINEVGGEYNYLLSQGIEVVHHDLPGDLHHKYCVLDADAPDSGPTVITGSHNWSVAAETVNDENTLIIHDADIASLYKAEFEQRWSEITVSAQSPADIQVKAFPNPATDVLTIQYEASTAGNVLVKNILGTTVLQTNADGSGTEHLNTENLLPGFYFAVIETRHGLATVPFQKI